MRQLLPNVQRNWQWGEKFSENMKKYFQIYYFLEIFFPFIFAYLAAPYRAAAAPKGALTHWKSTEAADGGRKKFS